MSHSFEKNFISRHVKTQVTYICVYMCIYVYIGVRIHICVYVVHFRVFHEHVYVCPDFVICNIFYSYFQFSYEGVNEGGWYSDGRFFY